MNSNIKANLAVVMEITYMGLADKVNMTCRQGTTIITNSNNNEPLHPLRNRLVPYLQALLLRTQNLRLRANTVLQRQRLVLQARSQLQRPRHNRSINLIIPNNILACILTGILITATFISSTMVVIPIIIRATRVCIRAKDMAHHNTVANKVVTTGSPPVINRGDTMHSVVA